MDAGAIDPTESQISITTLGEWAAIMIRQENHGWDLFINEKNLARLILEAQAALLAIRGVER